MKKQWFNLLLVGLLIMMSKVSVSSQLSLGLKGGLSSFDMAREGLILKDESANKYKINYEDSKYGFHLGLYAEAKISLISLDVGALFNSTRINYSYKDINATEIVKSFKTYRHLDVPVLIGINISRLKIHAGPVAHMFLLSSGAVLETENYEEMFKEATYGYQAGVALRLLWNMTIELNYEGNFDVFGESFKYKNTNYYFSNTPQRLIASLTMRLL